MEPILQKIAEILQMTVDKVTEMYPTLVQEASWYTIFGQYRRWLYHYRRLSHARALASHGTTRWGAADCRFYPSSNHTKDVHIYRYRQRL